MQLSRTLLALAAVACVTGANANIVTVTGTTTGDPTFNRPLEDFSGLSAVGTAVRYDIFEFNVSISGEYTFLTTAPTYDPFVFLYGATFTPATPLAGGLVGNDDLLGFTTSGFAFNLVAGQTYKYINTGFGNTDFGAYSNTIGGPGLITQVPETGTYALMALGLGMLGIARRRAKAMAA